MRTPCDEITVNERSISAPCVLMAAATRSAMRAGGMPTGRTRITPLAMRFCRKSSSPKSRSYVSNTALSRFAISRYCLIGYARRHLLDVAHVMAFVPQTLDNSALHVLIGDENHETSTNGYARSDCK